MAHLCGTHLATVHVCELQTILSTVLLNSVFDIICYMTISHANFPTRNVLIKYAAHVLIIGICTGEVLSTLLLFHYYVNPASENGSIRAMIKN